MMRHPPPKLRGPRGETLTFKRNVNLRDADGMLPAAQGPLVWAGPPWDPYIDQKELTREGYVGLYSIGKYDKWNAQGLVTQANEGPYVTLLSCASLSGQLFLSLLEEPHPYR